MTNNYEKIKEIEKLVDDKKKEMRKEIEDLERKKADLMYLSEESVVVVCEYGSPDDYETHVTYYDFGVDSVDRISHELGYLLEHSERKFDERYYIRVVSFEESRLYYKLSLLDDAKYNLVRAMFCFDNDNEKDSLRKAIDEIARKREEYIKALGIKNNADSVWFAPGRRLFHEK